MARQRIKIIHTWYAKNERIISTFSLIGGFVFNALTLTRVDEFMENFWVIVHLAVVGACIILLNRQENPETTDTRNPERLHFWLVTVLQFTFGGLLSTFIVFYLRSAVLAIAWPFFLILVLAFVANESLKHHYSRVSFQIGFFFLSMYLFAIFIVPVLMHQISTQVFLMSGGLSVIALIGFIALLRKTTNVEIAKVRAELLSIVAGIFVVVNVFYFLNIIPPLPLALTDAGIYHSISRTTDGAYTVTLEPESIREKLLTYISVYTTFHTTSNSLVYAYSSIFSPLSFNTDVTHQWQKYDPTAKKWATEISVDLSVSGGRAQGYRTYSINSDLTDGKWRVNVLTPSGQLVGRMAFEVVLDGTPQTLLTETKE